MPQRKRTKVRRRERKAIPSGKAFILSTFNNTIVTLADPEGNVIAWGSSGTAGFKGSRKGTPYAAQLAAHARCPGHLDGVDHIESQLLENDLVLGGAGNMLPNLLRAEGSVQQEDRARRRDAGGDADLAERRVDAARHAGALRLDDADRVVFAAEGIAPMVTWGITPAQSVFVGEPVPGCAAAEDAGACEVHSAALRHMRVAPGQDMRETAIDVAFIGSCTNGRISDLRAAAEVVRGRRVAPGVRALVVPGSMRVRDQAVAEGLDGVFTGAGFEWREPGCSMCIGMNADKLGDGQLCASSSNRNFIGRQGSAGGRTLLMSPAMVAAAAIRGRVGDTREFLSGEYGNG